MTDGTVDGRADGRASYVDSPDSPEGEDAWAHMAWVDSPDDVPTAERGPSAGAWALLAQLHAVGIVGLWHDTTTGRYHAHFLDDGELAPVADMAYSQTLGLFRRSHFPHVADDDPP